MHEKNTILILYPPGGYGTFLDWSLNYFTGIIADDLPFLDDGSSHKFYGWHLDSSHCISTRDFLQSDKNVFSCRSHSPIEVSQYLELYGKYFKKIIIIQPTENTAIQTFCNAMLKVKDHTKTQWLTNIYSQNQINTNEPIWSQREKLSYYIEGYAKFYHKWYSTDLSDVHLTNVNDLCYNYKSVLINLIDKLNLKFNSDRFLKIDNIYSEWKTLQPYFDLDNFCSDLAQKIANRIEYQWDSTQLNLFSESYVQYLLRSKYNIELNCCNLDIFPCSSLEFQPYL